jgi:UDP-N-acetylmuramoyl-tripeptide--D-alanyl-D-alanine ligase
MAEFWRRRYPIPLVAITGSNGKTTTKEMVAAIFSQSWRVLKNHGTFNNLVGVPLTLLQLNSSHQAAVIELGMNQPGEIERLTEITHPDVGMITNIQPAHLEGLGSLAGFRPPKGNFSLVWQRPQQSWSTRMIPGSWRWPPLSPAVR